MKQSLAKSHTLTGAIIVLVTSLIHIKKSNVPKTESWGAPKVTGNEFDTGLEIFTNWRLFEGYASFQHNREM